MHIDTTVNISKNNRSLFVETAKELKITKSELFIILITKYLNHYKKDIQHFKKVSYQKRNFDGDWKKMHIWISPGFYEKCIDLRKFQKLSLSYILALAIKLYLKEIKEVDTDIYLHQYVTFYSFYKSTLIFTIMWNYPEEKVVKKVMNMHEKLKL